MATWYKDNDSGLKCPKCDGRLSTYGGKHVDDWTYKRYRKCAKCGHHVIGMERISNRDLLALHLI